MQHRYIRFNLFSFPHRSNKKTKSFSIYNLKVAVVVLSSIDTACDWRRMHVVMQKMFTLFCETVPTDEQSSSYVGTVSRKRVNSTQPYLHKVGNVGRFGIFLFQFKFYFLMLILTYQFF